MEAANQWPLSGKKEIKNISIHDPGDKLGFSLCYQCLIANDCEQYKIKNADIFKKKSVFFRRYFEKDQNLIMFV
mgnify:CR=1 FL=1